MPGTDDECRRAPVAAGKTPGQPMPESLSAGQSGNLTYLQRDQLCQCLYKSLGLSLVATLSIDNAPNYNRICQDTCLSNCSERFPGSRKRMSGATRPERDGARIAIQLPLRKVSRSSLAIPSPCASGEGWPTPIPALGKKLPHDNTNPPTTIRPNKPGVRKAKARSCRPGQAFDIFFSVESHRQQSAPLLALISRCPTRRPRAAGGQQRCQHSGQDQVFTGKVEMCELLHGNPKEKWL